MSNEIIRKPGGSNLKWTPESCKQAFDHFVSEHGRLPMLKDLCKANKLPHMQTLRNATGKWLGEYKRQTYPEYYEQCVSNSKWTADSCIAAIKDYILAHGRVPTQKEMRADSELPSAYVFRKLTGQSPREFCKGRFPDLCVTRTKWSPEQCKVISLPHGSTPMIN